MLDISEYIVSYINLILQEPVYLVHLLPASLLLYFIYLAYQNTYDPDPPPRLKAPSYANPKVLSVSLSATHTFTKYPTPSITLIKDLGVSGDAHLGVTVQHLSRLKIQPPPPNLRQVHLIQNEILQEYSVAPAEIGENITTTGIDLLNLSKGTKLRFIPSPPFTLSNDKQIESTSDNDEIPTITVQGLRNPCPQIESHRKGLQEKFIVRDAERNIIARKAGVMCTVDVGGEIRPGMKILVTEPEKFEALGCV